MGNPMSLVERLRNPAWEVIGFGLPSEKRSLHTERTIADMKEAADEIERLRSLAGAVTDGQSFAEIAKRNLHQGMFETDKSYEEIAKDLPRRSAETS